MAAQDDSEEAVAIHAKIPKALEARLLIHLATLRKKDPRANLSDAIRSGLDRGLPRGKKR